MPPQSPPTLSVVVVALLAAAGLCRASYNETVCTRPRSSSALTEAILLKDHIVGVWTGRCTLVNNCNGHGYCRPVSQTCVCHDGYGGINDIYDYASPDCSTRTAEN